jgi:hypothetical protein
MALDYGALEKALEAWLVVGTGLSYERILNRDAKKPQPAMPYVEYKLPAANPSDGRDELRTSYDASAALGAEVVYATRGNRYAVVNVKVTTKAAIGNVDDFGRYTARQYIEGAINALALPPVRTALRDAGLSFVDVLNVTDLSDRSGPLGAGRASADVRFRCVDSSTASTGYIATVNPTGTLTP